MAYASSAGQKGDLATVRPCRQAQRDAELKLGTWVDNQRRRAGTLTPEQVEQLSKVGMRWA
ncbi:helicase associated domain-containing protein [Streptomyces sp. ISL-44]|uniref:helicase associated domain-containing protein n=1 Tax=Streptomyces sp. ISL-44 TaxID=2819184 RepID=UPI001BEC1C64|nr:helicase associated domain-containing protein [Streptomyces sp. ISL-44]MBT2540561.1 helicase associated domain-containing protein [Streptomyces sp. ISL-44]